MFNKKGEIATLLTLGLVVLGGILAIGSSIFLSKQKTSINTKAAGDTLECRTSQTEWKCNKDNFTADQNAKNAFCGVYAGLINGSDFNGVINKWKEEYERNKEYSPGACSGTATAPDQPAAGGGRSVSNGCFSLSANFEVREEGINKAKAFYATVTFSKGGHNNIYYNGIPITNGISLSYGPAWTHPPFPGCGAGCSAGIAKFPNDQGSNRVDFTYLGGIEECSPKTVSLSCAVGVNTNNQTYVFGDGCSCKNCGATSAPIPPIQLPTSPSGKINTPTPVPACGGKIPVEKSCYTYGCKIGEKPKYESYYTLSKDENYKDVNCKIPTTPSSYCCDTKTACGGTTPIKSFCSSYGDASGTYCEANKIPNKKTYYVWSGDGSYDDISCLNKIVPSSYCCDPKSEVPPLTNSSTFPTTQEEQDRLCSQQTIEGSYCGAAVGWCTKTPEQGYAYNKDFNKPCKKGGIPEQINGYCCVKTKLPEQPREMWLTVENGCKFITGQSIPFVINSFTPGGLGNSIPVNVFLDVGKSTSFDMTYGKKIPCQSWGILNLQQPGHLPSPRVINNISCDNTTNIVVIEGGYTCPW